MVEVVSVASIVIFVDKILEAASEMSTVKNATNLVGLKMNYLVDSGEKFINSRLNKCN